MAETLFWRNILYKSSESQYRKQKTIGYNVYGDLKLNELLDYCCRQYPGLNYDDIIKYTLDIMKYPCQIREDIEYRQQIFSQLLEKKEHCDKLYELFRDVNILYKTKEMYDNKDIIGEYSDYLAAVNDIFFIKSYQLFLRGIKDYMESMNIQENAGLYFVYEYIKNELDNLNEKEIIPAIDGFAALFDKKQTIIAELPYFKNVFTDYNFDYKCDYKGYDVPENCFIQNLKSVEDFMELKNTEKDHKFVDISDFKYIRHSPNFNNFEKRTLLNMFEAAENEGINIAEPIRKIKEIHDAIDISGLVEISEQLKFYLCMCKAINFINETADNYLCFPAIDDSGKKADILEMFDPVVLIQKHSEQISRRGEREAAYKNPKHEISIGEIVTNNISFDDFGMFIITGANNGGKTSFVRAMGICIVLYGAGCPVPAKKAKFKTGLIPHTHFVTEETHTVESGRLQDELRRVSEILEQCDNSSVVILNETYTGTNAVKALDLFEDFLREAKKSRLTGFFVTHFHNIALHADDVQTGEDTDFNEEKTALYSACVNLKALVDEETGKRTFKVVPYKPSDTSYSREIVEKHRLTWEHMSEYLTAKRGVEIL